MNIHSIIILLLVCIAGLILGCRNINSPSDNYKVISVSLLDNEIVVQFESDNKSVLQSRVHYDIVKKQKVNELHLCISHKSNDGTKYSHQCQLTQVVDFRYSLNVPIDSHNDLPLKVFLFDSEIAAFGAPVQAIRSDPKSSDSNNDSGETEPKTEPKNQEPIDSNKDSEEKPKSNQNGTE
ncbi:MAG: hypothetical protein ACRC2T_05415 [Thermoguttaceae bacterium]